MRASGNVGVYVGGRSHVPLPMSRTPRVHEVITRERPRSGFDWPNPAPEPPPLGSRSSKRSLLKHAPKAAGPKPPPGGQRAVNSTERRRRIAELYESGMGPAEIARTMGLHSQSVSRHLRLAGVARRYDKIDQMAKAKQRAKERLDATGEPAFAMRRWARQQGMDVAGAAPITETILQAWEDAGRPELDKMCAGGCGYELRPKGTPLSEAPGTRLLAARDRCPSCRTRDDRERKVNQ